MSIPIKDMEMSEECPFQFYDPDTYRECCVVSKEPCEETYCPLDADAYLDTLDRQGFIHMEDAPTVIEAED